MFRRLHAWAKLLAIKESLYPSPLSLCLLSQEYPPGLVGGIGRMTAEIARGLAQRGHSVHVVTRSHNGAPRSIHHEDGVLVHRIPPAPPGALPPPGIAMPAQLWLHSLAAAQEVEWIAQRHRVDLVDAPIWDAEGLATILDGRWTCVTSLETPLKVMLQLNPEWLAAPESREYLEALLEAERMVVNRSHAIRAISAAVLKTVESEYALDLASRHCAVVPLGIRDDPDPGAVPRGSADAVEVLFTGRFERRKGIDVLLEVIPSLCRQFPSLRFTLAGSDREPVPPTQRRRTDNFLSRFAADPILPRVTFAGPVTDQELAQLYRRCDIFAAPSLYESFGIVFLEAMRASKPVVGCRIGGMPEVIAEGETGLLAEPGDAASLHSALATLVADSPLRHKMGRAGRLRFERHFALERNIQSTIGFYLNVRRHVAAGR